MITDCPNLEKIWKTVIALTPAAKKENAVYALNTIGNEINFLHAISHLM